MVRSSWTTGHGAADLAGAIVVHAYGDDDDALRMVAELAGVLGGDEDARRACLAPASSWKERTKGLVALLDARRRVPQKLVLVDLDALPAERPHGEDQWADLTFWGARHGLRQLLVAHATSSDDVVLVRPSPRPDLTSDLIAAEVPCLDADDELAEIEPYARPLAQHLIGSGALSTRAIDHWIKTVEAPDLTALVVEAAYEHTPLGARRALHSLVVLRGRQALNGVAGPFRLGDASSGLELRRADVDDLRARGWLQPAVGRAGFELPSRLRELIAARARIAVDHRPLHREIASRAMPRFGELGVAESIEVHRHAVESGDSSLAISTARFYANDLRQLGFHLSKHLGRFAEAADVYRAIVTHDASDAYAHEYLAYNLDRSRPSGQRPGDDVLAHYAQAKELERDNPLFIGRWLECRARRGENVAPELKRYIRATNQRLGMSGVSYLAFRPLQQMSAAQRADVDRDWGWLLRRDDELRALLS